MARVPPEAAMSGNKQMRGTAPPSRPIRSAGPVAEPAFRTTSGASVNKTSVPVERQAFKSRPGSGNGV